MTTYAVRCREPQGRSYDYPIGGLGEDAVVSFVDGVARLDSADPRLGAFRNNPRYTLREEPDQADAEQHP